ncbi:MAG: hypothetical protein WCL32_22555 [Planctomycetota bacterium]
MRSPTSLPKKAAAAIATGAKKMKADLEGEKFADFDKKKKQLHDHYASQRADFKNSVKLLMDLLVKVEAAPTLKSATGTTFSGPFRNFQNKVGNLPEFADLYNDEYDGLIVETANLTKKSPDEVKKILLKLVQDVRNYIAKVLKRAKEKGY